MGQGGSAAAVESDLLGGRDVRLLRLSAKAGPGLESLCGVTCEQTNGPGRGAVPGPFALHDYVSLLERARAVRRYIQGLNSADHGTDPGKAIRSATLTSQDEFRRSLLVLLQATGR
jgi:hypothetical protein